MAVQVVRVDLTQAGGITIEPWIMPVSLRNFDSIEWRANRCKIKIEPEHPEHFSPRLPDKYKVTVRADFDPTVPNGTYKYRISVLEDTQGGADVAVYSVDPDYKVDR